MGQGDKLLDTLDELKAVAKTLGEITARVHGNEEEIVTAAFADNEVYISFPTIWYPGDGTRGGKAPDDPLTVRLSVWDYELNCDRSITEELKQDIKTTREDGSYADGLERIGLAMQALAAEILDAVVVGRAKRAKRCETCAHEWQELVGKESYSDFRCDKCGKIQRII